MASAQPCHPPDYTCIWFLGVHGTVRLQVDETVLQKSNSEEVAPEVMQSKDTSLLQSLWPPVRLTVLPLGSIGIHGGITGYIAPAGLGYSVVGSENSQFAQHIQAFINMAERSSTGLTGSDIVSFFNLFDDKMYSFFDSKFNKQLQVLQERFLARAPDDREKFEKFNFTEQFVTFASDEMLKHDFFNTMQVIRKFAGLYWREHYSCISEKLYCPGSHANQCSFYFPGVHDDLHDHLRAILCDRRKLGKPGRAQPPPDADEELFKGLSIEFSSDQKAVLTITFENDPNGRGFVQNQRWKGIPLNLFFEQIKRYLKFIFQGVEDFDGILNRLMSRTCVIDTACANFSVTLPGQHVSIIGFDNTAVRCAGASMLIDIHNDPTVEMGWWERKINPPPPLRHADGAVTHSRHRLLIPRDLVSYVPRCLDCNTTIKSVEPIFEPTTGRIVSVVYTYHDGRRETIAREPQLWGAAGATTTAAGFTESMGAVQGEGSPLRDIMSITDDDVFLDLGGGRSLGRRKLLRNTRRGRYLRNKSKSKRDKKIRGLGVRRTRRKRTRRTLRR
jgi:hypothetical protein